MQNKHLLCPLQLHFCAFICCVQYMDGHISFNCKKSYILTQTSLKMPYHVALNMDLLSPKHTTYAYACIVHNKCLFCITKIYNL